jgi:hypothetical protein
MKTNICDNSLLALGAVHGKSCKIPIKNGSICEICSKIIGASIKRKERHIFRRAFSETKLLEILDYDFDITATYHCISGGDIDSLSYLKHILRKQKLDYCLLSTWCMAEDDILQIREWIENDTIGRLDCYCGEIFPGSYSNQFEILKDVVRLCNGRVCIFRNHSKIFAGTGDKFSFAIESSANINTNPRTENTTISFGDDIFQFYKDFYDETRSYNREFDDWKKWNP